MSVGISDLTKALDDFAVGAITAMGEEFVARAKMRTPRASGELWNSISHGVGSVSGASATITVEAEAEYASWQDEGTGIYGPTGNRIYPTSAKALVFYWPPVGKTVAFASVAGVQPTNFWSDVVNEFDSWVGDTQVPDAE